MTSFFQNVPLFFALQYVLTLLILDWVVTLLIFFYIENHRVGFRYNINKHTYLRKSRKFTLTITSNQIPSIVHRLLQFRILHSNNLEQTDVNYLHHQASVTFNFNSVSNGEGIIYGGIITIKSILGLFIRRSIFFKTLTFSILNENRDLADGFENPLEIRSQQSVKSGIEFLELGPYREGDPIKSVVWGSYNGQTYKVKRYLPEVSIRYLMVIDCHSDYNNLAPEHFRHIEEIALSLGRDIRANGDGLSIELWKPNSILNSSPPQAINNYDELELVLYHRYSSEIISHELSPADLLYPYWPSTQDLMLESLFFEHGLSNPDDSLESFKNGLEKQFKKAMMKRKIPPLFHTERLNGLTFDFIDHLRYNIHTSQYDVILFFSDLYTFSPKGLEWPLKQLSHSLHTSSTQFFMCTTQNIESQGKAKHWTNPEVMEKLTKLIDKARITRLPLSYEEITLMVQRQMRERYQKQVY